MARLDIFGAISAAAAQLHNATMDESNKQQGAAPRVQPKSAGSAARVQPKTAGGTGAANAKGTAGTANAKGTAKVQPKATKTAAGTTSAKGAAGAGSAGDGKAKAKPIEGAAAGATNDYKALFGDYLRGAIEAHLKQRAKTDAAFAVKMMAVGKSIDGCLNYIGEHYYRQAQKQRKTGYVGVGGRDEELFGMAVHYFDETNETLKKELNAKEG